MNDFITIQENVQAEITEKKSKFIANLFYVENIKQAEELIRNTKKKYFDARHNCIAYRVVEGGNLVERFSDDGEPSGTAGAPMLNILQKNGLANVLVVVTRYFGGILLGTGGLVRAYSESLQKVLEQSELIEKCIGDELQVTLQYSDFENFKYYCKNNQISITKSEYFENIICNIELEEQKTAKLLEDFETKAVILENVEKLAKKYITKSIEK
jgi:uncharacterized YigZ family protein